MIHIGEIKTDRPESCETELNRIYEDKDEGYIG